MRILVLGGTSFAGRAIVADALDAGAEVTLFGRGRTGADLFPGLTRLIGDRDTGPGDTCSSHATGSWVSGDHQPYGLAELMGAGEEPLHGGVPPVGFHSRSGTPDGTG